MNEAGGKARLVYDSGNKLSVDFVADYQYVKQNGFAYGLYDEKQEQLRSRHSIIRTITDATYSTPV